MFPRSHFAADAFPPRYFADRTRSPTPPPSPPPIDPVPTLSPDIARPFESGFPGAPPGSGWSVRGGSWAQVDGLLRASARADEDPKVLVWSGTPVSSEVEVGLLVRLDRPGVDPDERARTGVSVRVDARTGHGYGLVLRQTPAGRVVQFLNDRVAWGRAWRFDWSAGHWYALRLRARGPVLEGKAWPAAAPEPEAWPYRQEGWVDRPSGTVALIGGPPGRGFEGSFRPLPPGGARP